jgi:anti-sigma B factor antagonist
MAALETHVAVEGATATLTLAGEADLAVAEAIFDQGAAALAQDSVTALVIDLAQLTFIDSTSISALVRLHNLVEESGQTVALARVPARVQRILQIAGLAEVFG